VLVRPRHSGLTTQLANEIEAFVALPQKAQKFIMRERMIDELKLNETKTVQVSTRKSGELP
jgi:hypothetical protein